MGNSLFGSFSKRSIKPNGLFGLRVQRDDEPMDLFSVGKKNSFLVCGPEDTRCFKMNIPPMFEVLEQVSWTLKMRLLSLTFKTRKILGGGRREHRKWETFGRPGVRGSQQMLTSGQLEERGQKKKK